MVPCPSSSTAGAQGKALHAAEEKVVPHFFPSPTHSSCGKQQILSAVQPSMRHYAVSCRYGPEGHTHPETVPLPRDTLSY